MEVWALALEAKATSAWVLFGIPTGGGTAGSDSMGVNR